MPAMTEASLPIQDRMRRCILLLAGAAGYGGVRSGLVLQSHLCVLAKKTGGGGIEGGFEPGELGPHGEEGAAELGRTAGDGLVSIEPGGRIAVARAGRAAARDAGKGLGERARAAIAGHVPFLNGMTDEELAPYMQLVYPGMSAGSRACAALARGAEGTAMGTVGGEKISSGRAAEVLGGPFREVHSTMKRHGIPNLRRRMAAAPARRSQSGPAGVPRCAR